MVKCVIAHKGLGIKKGHTLGKIMIELIENENFGDEDVVCDEEILYRERLV